MERGVGGICARIQDFCNPIFPYELYGCERKGEAWECGWIVSGVVQCTEEFHLFSTMDLHVLPLPVLFHIDMALKYPTKV